jgi:hypothetical protein
VGALLRLVTDKFQGVLPTTGKIAVHFMFNGGYMRSCDPAKLGSMAFQIHSHCGFTYTTAYKSGLPYGRSTASPGLPPIEFVLFSFPVVDLRLPAVYYLQAQSLAFPCWAIIHFGYWVILYFCRDVYYTKEVGMDERPGCPLRAGKGP